MDINVIQCVFNVFSQWFSPTTQPILGLSLLALMLLCWLLSDLPPRAWWALLLLYPLLAFWPVPLWSA
ncbi:hypothetical protein GCM10022631_35370 [Deinococcus rubellus]|uniref:Uncharacterized protein n=1 Tax=Deinococcus rubellus TaxID=1889240 RepID=A0ABY5YIL5_9DEIO|nr:hypothetical protein [Deinococcus rubellus]UWX64633.1 hypothetical protein N0D28_02925 [Deinococcus rubellus]